MKPGSWIKVSLAATVIFGTALADPPPVSHDDSFSKEGLFKADVASLTDTQLIAQPDVPLDPAKNVLWCGTLQLAWNKAIDLVGEKLHFANQPPIVDLLNRQDFTGADLDPGSYVALADFERNNVEDEIRAALQKTFLGAASPELIPPKSPHPGPDDFVAYAYLYKNLSFPLPFEEIEQPLQFGGKSVESFGFMENRDKLPAAVFGQVSIYDYQSPDDFIIKLKTKSPDDQLILAKITPGATLDATIADVLKRMTPDKRETALKRDELAVPKLNFDLRKDFNDLVGLVLQPGPDAKIKNKLVVTEVKQLVRFQLNENGAILKSEAAIAMAESIAFENPPKTHIMIFDKPVLILMKRANTDHPYFALWVGNPSLLVAAKPVQ